MSETMSDAKMAVRTLAKDIDMTVSNLLTKLIGTKLVEDASIETFDIPNAE
jgi:hypothetical protein